MAFCCEHLNFSAKSQRITATFESSFDAISIINDEAFDGLNILESKNSAKIYFNWILQMNRLHAKIVNIGNFVSILTSFLVLLASSVFFNRRQQNYLVFFKKTEYKDIILKCQTNIKKYEKELWFLKKWNKMNFSMFLLAFSALICKYSTLIKRFINLAFP